MSKGWKVATSVGALVLCLCAIACISTFIIGRYTLPKTIASQPEQAAKIGHEIVDYTLPAGYRELVGMSLFGAKWVTIASDSADTLMIMLMQFPKNVEMSQEEMQQQMERSLAQQNNRRTTNLKVVGTQKVAIKGSQVVLTVSEEQSTDDQAMRQVVGVFPGKAGVVMIMVMGEIKTWTQDVLDEFLASIQ